MYSISKKLDASRVNCPILDGRYSGVTILSAILQCKPLVKFNPDDLKKITKRIEEAGTEEVVKAKAGTVKFFDLFQTFESFHASFNGFCFYSIRS